MKYVEILDLFSENIFRLDQKISPGFSSLFTENTSGNLEVYRRNLLGGVIKSFSQDFPSTLKYLGSNNFNFFVRDYLIKNRIKSPNLFEVSKGFPIYLADHLEVHEEELVEFLASLDLFWSHQHSVAQSQISLPAGIAQFWEAILGDQDSSSIIIDFNKTENISLAQRGEESVLVIKNGEDL